MSGCGGGGGDGAGDDAASGAGKGYMQRPLQGQQGPLEQRDLRLPLRLARRLLRREGREGGGRGRRGGRREGLGGDCPGGSHEGREHAEKRGERGAGHAVALLDVLGDEPAEPRAPQFVLGRGKGALAESERGQRLREGGDE